MVDDPAVADLLEEQSGARGPGMATRIVVFVLMTLLAAGAGFGANMMLETMRQQDAAAQHASDAGQHADGHGSKDKAGQDSISKKQVGDLTTVELPVIITNLAAPADTWIRLELAVRFHNSPKPALIEDIHQDLMAFVRTMQLEQISGPSGYMHFKSDLAERAVIRSEGTADSILIKVLLFE